jgi:DNA-binding CsgD family transcriptional regulator
VSTYEVRPCRREEEHDPHYWGAADLGAVPLRCPGIERRFFYRDWEREVRRFHPPGPDQVQAARKLLAALEQWEEMPDTAGSRWAIKFITWLAEYATPSDDDLLSAATPERLDLRSLSPQERRIAQLVAQGLSDVEVARELFLSRRTVTSYVRSILDKLGLRQRREIGEWFGEST